MSEGFTEGTLPAGLAAMALFSPMLVAPDFCSLARLGGLPRAT
jgi:hypothetical protein